MTSLTLDEFGKQLVTTGDLDPIYSMLYNAKQSGVLTVPELQRWCFAYWMFYDANVASHILEQNGFWAAVTKHVLTKASKRGPERRHFRGEVAIQAVQTLAARYQNPSEAIKFLVTRQGAELDFATVARRVQTWPLFGPWISFKIADMLDRVLDHPVDFTNCDMGIYDEPLKGAWLWADSTNGFALEESRHNFSAAAQEAKLLTWNSAVKFLKQSRKLKPLKAGPDHTRPLNIQEYETMLCKYKGHLAGRYAVGHDIIEIKKSMLDGGALSHKLLNHLPEVPA